MPHEVGGAGAPVKIGQTITVRKFKWGEQQEALTYDATVVEVADEWVVLFAALSIGEFVVDGVPIGWGDRFTEYYYRDRWFNVFHIASAVGELKGWYCNVALPPEVSDDALNWVDLVLDLFVHPDGRYTVLDEDEFVAMLANEGPAINEEAVRAALMALIALAERRALPSPPGR